MMRIHKKSVPGIFYNDDTPQTALKWDGEGELGLLKYLGTVVLNALMANCLTWLPFVVFPWFFLEAGTVFLLYFIFALAIMFNVWLEFPSLKDQGERRTHTKLSKVSKRCL